MRHVDEVEPRDGDAVAHGHHRGEHAQVEGGHKRDLHGGLDAEQVHRHQHENGGDEKLADQLRLGREPERALVGHLRSVIDEPEDTGGHRGAEQKPQRLAVGAPTEASKVTTTTAMSMMTPPIVGVPCFTRWLWGPSARTCWPMWLVLQKADPGGHEHHGDHHGDGHAEEDHERGVGGEQREHQLTNPSTIRVRPMKCEAFTSTASPGSTQRVQLLQHVGDGVGAADARRVHAGSLGACGDMPRQLADADELIEMVRGSGGADALVAGGGEARRARPCRRARRCAGRPRPWRRRSRARRAWNRGSRCRRR